MNWRDRIVVDPSILERWSVQQILDEHPGLQSEDSDVLEGEVVIKRFRELFLTKKRLQELAAR